MQAPDTPAAAKLLVDCLAEQGCDRIFTVPGESFLQVLDGLGRQDAIDVVTCRQEGGVSFMACADGAMTGRPGVAFVTRGPGATNASIGVHVAQQDSQPMILFVGDVDSEMRDREGFQEVDFAAFFGPTDPMQYGPRNPHDIVLYRELFCSPCLTNYNLKISYCTNPVCIRSIGVEETSARIARQLVSIGAVPGELAQ